MEIQDDWEKVCYKLYRFMRDLPTFITGSGAEGQDEWAGAGWGTVLSPLVRWHLGASSDLRASFPAEGRGCLTLGPGSVRSPVPWKHASPPQYLGLKHGMANIFSPPDPCGISGMSSLARASASKL